MIEVLKNLSVIAISVAIAGAVIGQCRKPRWWLGRIILANMNARHANVTEWGLRHVSVGEGFTILDIGCGGGRTIATLAEKATHGKIHGIDYSPTSVAAARRYNARRIEAGQVDIRHGTVSELPFADRTFDLVTAVETHYYWPDPVADLKEVLRVLKPGGRVVVIVEAYKGDKARAHEQLAMKLLRATYLSVREHRDLFTAAGFADIETYEEHAAGWLCCIARRPA